MVAICGHKDNGVRAVEQGGVLEVVPSSNYGSDSIELEVKVQKPCGEHPFWLIDGEEVAHGPTHDFSATAPVSSKLWIPSINPKRIAINCRTCAGNTRSLQVHAYPPNELSVNLDLKKSLEMIRKITGVLETVLDTVADRFKWKYLEGKAVAQAAWKEYKDHRAFYGYDIGIKLDPLFGAEFKQTMGPGKITKLAGKIPGIGKYIKQVIEWLIKAGLYFKLSGGIMVDLLYKRDKPELPKFVAGLGAGVGGQIQAGIGAEGALVGDLAKVELEVSGAIKGDGSPFINDKGFGMGQFKVEFDGLKGNVKLIFLWGIVDVNETVTLVESASIYGPEDLYFYKC